MLVIRQVVKEKVFFFGQINRDLQHPKAQEVVEKNVANDTQISDWGPKINRIIFNRKMQ